ncbi:hypothetical protein [Paenibacillus pabuli]|uniref:hypothetical protein n=1 Tax=Paenibacillus pabuli TaxID=1472 RepID=UPI003CEEE083
MRSRIVDLLIFYLQSTENEHTEALYSGRLRPDETMMPTHPEYQLLGRQIAALTEH